MLSPIDPYEFDAGLLRSWRVLVVEDDADSLSAMVELMTLLKQKAVGVTNAEEAVTTLATERFDILCTDINLPQMSGIELAKQVLTQHPGMAIIIASGYGSATGNEVSFDAEVLAKPFGLADIARTLVRLAPRLNAPS